MAKFFFIFLICINLLGCSQVEQVGLLNQENEKLAKENSYLRERVGSLERQNKALLSDIRERKVIFQETTESKVVERKTSEQGFYETNKLTPEKTSLAYGGSPATTLNNVVTTATVFSGGGSVYPSGGSVGYVNQSASGYSSGKTVHVNGYTRKDGTVVSSYWRRPPSRR